MPRSIFFTVETGRLDSLDIITAKSKALNKRANITIFNPFEKSTLVSSAPFLILLHGVYGSHLSWALRGNICKTVQDLVAKKEIQPMVMVMPSDGMFGDGSGYVKHKNEDYERWIVEEVIQLTMEQVSQIDEKSKIFIAGLSMGGFGALRLGAKHAKKFTAFSGLSSITELEQMKNFVEDYNGFINNVVDTEGVLYWMKKNKLQLPPFRFDCGIDDDLIQANRVLHEHLNNQDIAHIYQEHDGGHSWDYWSRHIVDTLYFFDRLLLS